MAVLAACAPFFSPPTGFLPGPQSASASLAERTARYSVDGSAAAQNAARLAELIPGTSIPAAVVDRFFEGYREEIIKQIQALDAKIAAGETPSADNWRWALFLALTSGASNVFSFNRGQKTAKRTAPAAPPVVA